MAVPEKTNRVPIPRCLVSSVVAVCFLLSGVSLVAQCHSIHYRDGKVVHKTSSEIAAYISIEHNGFSPHKLICLAADLRHRYRDFKQISIFVFSDPEAAESYVPMGVEWSESKAMRASKLHAAYFYDAAKYDEYILVIPDHLAENEANFDTRISLPITGEPLCRLQVKGRCLVKFHHIEYPWEDGKAKTSGKVTLMATIGKNGSVINVQLADALVDSGGNKPVLVEAAIANLRTWRFETRKQDDGPIQITYSFEIVADPSLQHKTQVQFSLPDRVTIETGQLSVPINSSGRSK